MIYYLFAIIGNISCLLSVICALGIIISVLCVIGNGVYISDEDDPFGIVFSKISKWWFPFYAIVIVLTVFVPSQKQMAFIISAPYILENKDLQDAGNNTAEIIKLGTEYLKNILEDKKNDRH